jgi:predicted MFS family arabinose efflux permease
VTVVELVAPQRLGRDFRWLLASSWVSNLGDGIGVAAGPLLVASLTHDAFLVALAALLRGLPWLLFGLVAGAVADRVERRRLIAAVDLARAGVLAALTVAIATGTLSVALVLVCLFVVATAEVFADTTSQTLLPMLLGRADIPLGNARLAIGQIGVNQLVGPPVGAALFALGAAWPYAAQTLMVAAGALLVARIVTPTSPVERAPSHLRADIAEGFAWAVRHPATRTLILTITLFNVTFGAAWSILVLWARQRLGLHELGFGLLLATSALGSILAGLVYGQITDRLSLGTLMRVGLVFETVTHLGLALTTSPAVAFAILFVFGAHAMVWGTTSTSIRQLSVPDELQGRVNALNLVCSFGSMVVGSLIGGLLAQAGGVTTPFWFGFAGSAVFVVLLWRQLDQVAHD